MKKTVLALIAACFGCCALAFLLPGLAGLSLFGLSLGRFGLSLDTLLCALPLAALAVAGVYVLLRHRRRCAGKGQCQGDRSCGC